MAHRPSGSQSTYADPWLNLAKRAQVIPGYLPGFMQPSLRLEARLGTTEPDKAELGRFFLALGRLGYPDAPEVATNKATSSKFASSLRALLSAHLWLANALGLVMMTSGRWTGKAQPGAKIRFDLPCSPPQRVQVTQLFSGLIELMEQCRFASSPNLSPLEARIEQVLASETQPKNVPHFIREALRLDLPVRHLPLGIIQIGQGARSTWLDSSFTEDCSTSTSKLCRSKPATSAILRMGGLPVPDHAIASTVEEAVTIARRLGYPVVLKPDSLDGGTGVQAGLCSEDEVRSIFPKVAAHGRQVLVEKHAEGRDYRLVIFRGQLIAAIERQAGAVTGNGQLSVAELVSQRNDAGQPGPARLNRLELDDEALGLLRQAGLTLDHVPDEGETILLRRAANFARGGTARGVLDEVHPDNRDLAIQATHLLRLDLSGVDLIIPDIARSWRETGAAICEVNAQPHLGQPKPRNLFQLVLESLLPEGGRIPIVAIVGDQDAEKIAKYVIEKQDPDTKQIAIVASESDLEAAGRGPCIDRNIGAVIATVNHVNFLDKGFPFDKIDLVILAGNLIRGNNGEVISGQELPLSIAKILSEFGAPSIWTVETIDQSSSLTIDRQLSRSNIDAELLSWLAART